MQSRAWNVYLNNRLIDTVYCHIVDDAQAVRRSLIQHDGYDERIMVALKRRKKTFRESY